MIFKKIRSLGGRLFSENQQMLIIIWLSGIFWKMRKYFLGVEITYPDEFLDNWKSIKINLLKIKKEISWFIRS